MMKDFELFDSDFTGGKCLAIKATWTDEYLGLIQTHGIKHLRLSRSLGWTDTDLSFLSTPYLKNLVAIEIYNWGVESVQALQDLSQLNVICLEVNLKKPLDLNSFSDLKIFKSRWSNKIKNLSSCSILEELNIVNFDQEHLDTLNALRNLQKISLTSSKLINADVTCFKYLKYLDFYKCPKLSTIMGLRGCENLREIQIELCKNINVLPELPENITRLTLNDCGFINSLSSLRTKTSLEYLLFTGDTYIGDGNLDFLKDLPKLKTWGFMDRKHYSVKSSELKVLARA